MDALVTLIVTWVGGVGAIYAFFPLAEAKLRASPKANLTRWLKGDLSPEDSWLDSFIVMFDYMFRVRSYGSRIILPSLWRSCAVSLVGVSLFLIAYLNLYPQPVSVRIVADFGLINPLIPYDVAIYHNDDLVDSAPLDLLLLFPITLNFIGDYVSLAETRYILKWMTHVRRQWLIAVLFVFDMIVSFAIAYVAYIVSSAAISAVFFGREFFSRLGDFSIFFWSTLSFFNQPIGNVDAVFIFSTFVTSIWLWSFLLSALLIRLLIIFPTIFNLINRWFRLETVVENNPLTLLGGMLLGIFTVLIVALALMS